MAAACLLAVLCTARTARGSEDLALGMALVACAGLVLVAPIGAMVKTVEGEPSKEWGRASLVGGGLATAAGSGVLIGSAFVYEEERTPFYVFGGITLGLGLNGLLSGIVSEAMLPEEDPGIAGQPRPPSEPASITIRGRF